MNKKGFTLFEVIVSIVLISIVLISMMATLVKIKDSYEIVYENSDALIYSSSIARIMNNDFEKNGGIRYVDCNYDGNTCDITLNNDQKRKIEIYNVYLGHKVTEADKLKYYHDNGTSIQEKKYVTEDDNIFCEETNLYDNLYFGVSEGTEISKVDAECGKMGDEPIRCTCAKEIVATTLRYSDTTNISSTNNIYLKTLKAEKSAYLVKDNALSFNTKLTYSGQSSSIGYTFGKISFTNMIYDSSTKYADTAKTKPFKNSISTISIQINDGIDTENPTYNINLSSTSVFDPSKVQTGQTLCFQFYNNDSRATTIEHDADALCIKYGVGFYIREKGKSDLKEVKANQIDLKYKPKITPNYEFEGYYYNNPVNGKSIQIIDKDMKIKISTNYFDKTTQCIDSNLSKEECDKTENQELIRFEGKWEDPS